MSALAYLTEALGVAFLAAGALGAHWLTRTNRSELNPGLELETWDAVADGMHNSNTDLILWRERFYLIHAASPYHLGSPQCRLVLWRSADARQWEKVSEFSIPGEDIRDPKFASIGDRLFLYALPNKGVRASPYGTIYSTSADGISWSPLAVIEQPGWLFWRPKTRDGETWYVPAYWKDHGRSMLFSSSDGIEWKEVSTIYQGEANDETDCEFLPDGRMLCTARLEVTADNPLGNALASTAIAVAPPPYKQWRYVKSHVTRLDGPALFSYSGRIYAVARFQPGRRGPFTKLGSMFSRKRTSLFLIEESRMVRLADLPSAGDTSYAGVAVRGDTLFASYYTSDITRDYPWCVGMMRRSDIRMAKIGLPSLARIAARA